MGGDGGESVRFDGEEEKVDATHGGRVVGSGEMRLEAALGAPDADAVLLHRAEVRPTSNEGDVLTGQCQLCAKVCADGPRAVDCEPHGCFLGPLGPGRGALPGKGLGDEPALELAGGAAWNLLNDMDDAGTLEVGEAGLAVGHELRGCRLAVQNDRGGWLLAVGGMRDAESHGFGDGRVVEKHFVDLPGARSFHHCG